MLEASDAAVVAFGHQPNGCFWEALVRFAWPDTAEHVDCDSEAGMFCAVGKSSDAARASSRAPRQSAVRALRA
ncbi:Imm51 family immunity protein [Streptomyces sp. ALB3]|uniref:Imm51 family immunity protein n=1 Tax=Streptomyces sp. ALB3 TaxID=3374278 RepID=UPI0037B5C6B6